MAHVEGYRAMPTKTPRHHGKLCVSLSGDHEDEILALALKAEPLADVLEIRLDSMRKPSAAPFAGRLAKPLLFTNRASWEGGGFAGPEEERLALLRQAAEAKAAYIDIELKTEAGPRNALIRAAKDNGTQVIVSWHGFNGTPSAPALRSLLQEQCQSGADIGKIVTTAHGFQDVLRVLNLQIEAAEIGLPLIAFCMGQAGVISRVATLGLGGFMTYAAADHAPATAPGQLPASSLARILTELGSHAG